MLVSDFGIEEIWVNSLSNVPKGEQLINNSLPGIETLSEPE